MAAWHADAAVTANDLPAAFSALPAAWAEVLPLWTASASQVVCERVRAASADRPIAPSDPFRALRLVSPDRVKVVILGQDPYPTAGHADGLAFSAGRGKPRSLARVFDVLAADRPGFVPPADWRLDDWAGRGVLLLNPVLTVEVGRTGSHLDCGWQSFTAQVIRWLCDRADPPVFLLWGSKARDFFAESAGLGASRVRVLATRHPSYDFQRTFMADGSHFHATSHLVDWWAFGGHGCSVL